MKGWKHLPLSVLPPLPHFAVLGFHRLIRATCPSLYGQGSYIPYFTLSSLSYRFSFYSTIGAFPNAAHDLLCSFSGNLLTCLYCSSVVLVESASLLTPGDCVVKRVLVLPALLLAFVRTASTPCTALPIASHGVSNSQIIAPSRRCSQIPLIRYR